MKKRGSLWSVVSAVLVGCLLLAVLLSYLKREGLFDKPSGEPVALTGFGVYSPVEIDGAVYLPRVTDGELSYELARHAQSPSGAPCVMTAAGTAPLPENYIARLYKAYKKVDYSPDDFHDYDRHYLIAATEGGSVSVCGVVIRHNEQFYLGNLQNELSDTLLAELVGAISSLGER